MIPESEWEWFGNVGHFVCGRWCRFHLFTKIGEHVVSTVGEYVHPRNSGGCESTEVEWLTKNWPGEDIGHGRKYETMVFKTDGTRCEGECGCLMPGIIPTELEMLGYNTAKEAHDGHMMLCRKWASKEAA